MRISLPLAYEAEARRRRSDEWKQAEIVERVSFDIPEYVDSEAPLAIDRIHLRDDYLDLGCTHARWIGGTACAPDRMPGTAVPVDPFGSDEGHDPVLGKAFLSFMEKSGPRFYHKVRYKGEDGFSAGRFRDFRSGEARERALDALSDFVRGYSVVEGTLYHAAGAPGYRADMRSPSVKFGYEAEPHRFRLDRRDDCADYIVRWNEASGFPCDPAEVAARLPEEPLVIIPEAAEFDDENEALPLAAQETVDWIRDIEAFRQLTSASGTAYYSMMGHVERWQESGDEAWIESLADSMEEFEAAVMESRASPGMKQQAITTGFAARRWRERPIMAAGFRPGP